MRSEENPINFTADYLILKSLKNIDILDVGIYSFYPPKVNIEENFYQLGIITVKVNLLRITQLNDYFPIFLNKLDLKVKDLNISYSISIKSVS